MTAPRIGDRVVTPRGDVGHIEEIEDEWAGVRLQTPDDEPSCLTSWTPLAELRCGRNVLPQPMSKAWKRQAAIFCAAMTQLVETMLDRGRDER